MYKIFFLSLTSCISVYGYLDIFPTITTKTSNTSLTYPKSDTAVTNQEETTQKDYIKLMVDNYKKIAVTSNPKSKKHVSIYDNLINLPEITTNFVKPHVGVRSLGDVKRAAACAIKKSNPLRNNKQFPVKFLTVTARRICPTCDNEVEDSSESEEEVSEKNGRNNKNKFPNTKISLDKNEIEEVTTVERYNRDENEYESITDIETKVTSYEVFTVIEKSQYSNNISDTSEDWDPFSSFDSDQMNFSKTVHSLRRGVVINKSNETSLNMKSEVAQSNSCVFCNNIDNGNCNAPLNKLIPSIQCKDETDLCYSMHTPFGIVDRGCFSPYSTLSTFVCVQQLCNTITISELPFVFSKKDEWIRDVKEISTYFHSVENFRAQPLFCLKCEVNITTRESTEENIKCLSGSLDQLRPQVCREDEICGIKVIRKQNYIWRGCLKFPLYNYWWQFCSSDHCNFEELVTIYD